MQQDGTTNICEPYDWPTLLRLLPGYDPFADAGDHTFDEASADHAVGFFHDHLRFFEGERAGQPFDLEPWQKAIIGNLFGWKRPDGTRRYRSSYIGVARKNGKTPLAAGIVLYVGFCDNEPGAQIYSAAGERDQAALIFRHAAGMIRSNPALAQRCRVYKTFKSLEFYGGDSLYRALSASPESKHGLNAHLVVVDELHVQKTRDLVDALTTAMASRTQPLTVYTTTAGYDRHSICWEVYQYARQVRDGVIDDPSFLPAIYEVADDADWRDERSWRDANPNLGVSVSLSYLRREFKKAEQLPAYENTFRRLHLNQWVEQECRWISLGAWDACDGPVDGDRLAGAECYAALDMSSTRDLSALSLVFPGDDEVAVLPFGWIPRDRLHERVERDRVPYDVWLRQGLIEATPGDVIDYAYIRKRVLELGQRYGIRQIAIDRWNASQIMQELAAEGMDVVPFGQGFASMSAPSKRLEELVLSGKLRHGGHPVLRWCLSNCAVEIDPAENIKPSKKKSFERIDMVVATIMAIGLSMLHERPRQSIYERTGLMEL